MAQSLQKQIAQQQAAIAESRKKIADLKAKAWEKESKRFQRLAEKVGFLEADITDESLEAALHGLVESARSPTDQPGG